MSKTGARFGFLCSIAAFALIADSAGAGDITIPINYDNKQTKNLEDVTIKFLSTVDKIVDHDGFTKPAEGNNPNSKTVKFSGGNIAPGTNDSIIAHVAGDTASYTILKYSYTDGTSRTTSTGDNINDKVVFGGASGRNFLGVNIAAGTYGYFYQFDRNSSFASSPVTLALQFNSPNAPTGFGVISNTFGPSINSDLSGPTVTGTDTMEAANLTGNSGVAPISWSFDSAIHTMLAEYAPNAFGVGDNSSILYFTSNDAPQLPLDVSSTAAPNAELLDSAGGVLFTNFVDTPFVPEPSSVQLFLIGATCLVAFRFRRLGSRLRSIYC